MMQNEEKSRRETPVEIRPMEQSDLSAAARMEQECFGDSAWSFQALSDELKRPDAVLLCARLEGEMVGYVGMRTVLGEGYVNDIAVLPRMQRRGIGMQLVRALVEMGQNRQLSFITLEARVSNTGAISLYERAGFRDVGVRRGFYDFPREDARLMTIFFEKPAGEQKNQS